MEIELRRESSKNGVKTSSFAGGGRECSGISRHQESIFLLSEHPPIFENALVSSFCSFIPLYSFFFYSITKERGGNFASWDRFGPKPHHFMQQNVSQLNR
ncbi:hypothetical protein TNCT_482411 [Trichonephila clavata]|uniref:Uncharacterized protein n=1 Tax=Trichonephila clavata TaxID=2740835 RepID=A0A8X6HRI4_TRICU|nr:hypothetical protein TNCT_482411 [Trichonephila clavata]